MDLLPLNIDENKKKINYTFRDIFFLQKLF
jgi:hypothetical protein